MRKRHRRGALLLLLLALLLGTVLLLRTQVAPLVRELSKAVVLDRASNIINEAIEAQLQRGDVAYDQIVLLEKDTVGNITALKTNMAQVNKLKAQNLTVLNEMLSALNETDIGVPIGSILFPTLLSGVGPSLPVKVLSISDADAEFRNAFSQAGINQTNHQILMDVIVDMTILTPAGTEKIRAASAVVVAETVIVGQVPNSYVNVGENNGP